MWALSPSGPAGVWPIGVAPPVGVMPPEGPQQRFDDEVLKTGGCVPIGGPLRMLAFLWVWTRIRESSKLQNNSGVRRRNPSAETSQLAETSPACRRASSLWRRRRPTEWRPQLAHWLTLLLKPSEALKVIPRILFCQGQGCQTSRSLQWLPFNHPPKTGILKFPCSNSFKMNHGPALPRSTMPL